MMKMDYIEKMVNRCGVILNIPKPNLKLHEFDSDEISAMFIPSSNSIVVNGVWLESANVIELFITICHEMSHAYQYFQVNNLIVTKEKEEILQK